MQTSSYMVGTVGHNTFALECFHPMAVSSTYTRQPRHNREFHKFPTEFSNCVQQFAIFIFKKLFVITFSEKNGEEEEW